MEDDSGATSTSVDDDGGLFVIGASPDSASSSVTIPSVSTPQGPMAFAVYNSPSNFVRGTADLDTSARFVSLRVETQSGGPHSVAVLIRRPPIVLIHGLWGGPDNWNTFIQGNGATLDQDFRFFVRRLKFDGPITGPIIGSDPTDPGESVTFLNTIRMNSMSYNENAPDVLIQLRKAIATYKKTYNLADVQVDVIGHSMGGLTARAMAALSNFQDNDSYGKGPIDKLITVGTPHLGTPLANLLLALTTNA